MEIGLGIHGEQGREQAAFPSEGSAKLVAGVLVNAVMEGGPFVAGDSVAVLVNNLGGYIPCINLAFIFLILQYLAHIL
jgi:dihydroxyacetone kinase